MRELVKHVGHLVAPLTAAHVHHHVGRRVPRQRLFDHGLTRTEPAGNGDRATLGDGEEEVEDPLPRDERRSGGKPLSHRSWLPYGPTMGKTQSRSILQPHHGIRYREATGRHLRHHTAGLWRHQNWQLPTCTFLHHAQHIARSNRLADNHPGSERPHTLRVQGGHGYPRPDEVAGFGCHQLQGPRHPIQDGTQKPRPQFHHQWLARGLHRFPHAQAARVLIHLNGGGVALQPDDLAQQLTDPHSRQFVKSHSP